MTAPASTQVARRDATAVRVRPSEALEQARERIEPYLPAGVNFQAVLSDVFIATRKNPELLKCDPESLVLAVCEAQQRGLRIGVTCYLVPKGGKVQCWNDYRGDVEMIVRSGACQEVEARPVYEGETFEYEEGIGTPHLRHIPEQDHAKRGPMKGAYAIYYTTRTRARVHYMPVEDINAIRQKYSLSWKTGPLPVWYALKTVVRQGAKLLPKNAALASVFAAFQKDDEVAPPPAPLGAPLIGADRGYEYEDVPVVGEGESAGAQPFDEDFPADGDQASLDIPAPASRPRNALAEGA